MLRTTYRRYVSSIGWWFADGAIRRLSERDARGMLASPIAHRPRPAASCPSASAGARAADAV
jgi:hypothetical protein